MNVIHRLLLRVICCAFILALILTGCEKEDSVQKKMRVIEERVSELRGLEPLEPVTEAFLTGEELRQQVMEDLEEDYSEEKVHDDVLLYVAFELAEPDLDLHRLLVDLYSEQVAGFYDPETEELYVVKGGQAFGAMERSTFSHEYTHALQDQHFDLEALGLTDEEEDADGDEYAEQDFATRCLVEGDASLLEQHYIIRYFDTGDWMEMFEEVDEIEMDVMESAPAIVRESLMFPYSAGMLFVGALHAEGGWPAVDAAYANPPLSTEQILHPERYPDDVPQIVTLPPLTDTLGVGWRWVDDDVMGEFGLGLYLEVHANSFDAEAAAQGWGGDHYAVHWREDESAFVMVLRLAWDTPLDAAEFFDTYHQFAVNRFGANPTRSEGDAHWWFGDDVLLLTQNSQDETLIIIAPDEPTLEAIHALFPEF